MKTRLVTSLAGFQEFVAQLRPNSEVAADVETYKTRPSMPNARLLGLALSGTSKAGEVLSIYISFCHYNKIEKRFITNLPFLPQIGTFVTNSSLVGWNVPFDKAWIDYAFRVDTKWTADGRILWHLQNNDYMIRGFGLKLAQKKLLGWEDSNDKALEENVKAAGGKLSNGDHYLADLDVLSHYAALDAASTLAAYNKLKVFMNQNDYWWFGDEILSYAILLSNAANEGLPVDTTILMSAAALYKAKRAKAEQEINQECATEIGAMQEVWKVKKLATYKTVKGRVNFLERQRAHRKFNPASGQQRALLLHEMMAFPVNEKTPTGLAKTDRANLNIIKHDVAQALIQYSECKKIYEATQTYLSRVEEDSGRLHTNYDVCGTVSGRLSGFRPSVLNMPFNEPEVMSAFTSVSDFVGIHADLASIEPCVLAHYSEDPTLLKVYKEGKGDIYLDLALDIFTDRLDLREGYDPLASQVGAAKSQFKALRDVCKTIHLAISYTGTHVTIAKNLTKQGHPTDKIRAMQLVSRYWKKFAKVKEFNQKLLAVYRAQGHVRNLVGRIIQVPDIYEKDLMNRLVQSSAHDVLRLWVTEIVKEFDARGVEWKHWLPDLHDSTTFMVRKGQETRAEACYMAALETVRGLVNLSVPLKCELKFIHTLAGVKVNE